MVCQIIDGFVYINDIKWYPIEFISDIILNPILKLNKTQLMFILKKDIFKSQIYGGTLLKITTILNNDEAIECQLTIKKNLKK